MNGKSLLWRAALILSLSAGVSSSAPADPPMFDVIDLGTLGGAEAKAYSINNLRQITGESRNEGNLLVAFVWEDGLMVELAQPAEGSVVSGRAINEVGEVTGQAFNPSIENRAFLFSGGESTVLGTLGGNASLGRDVNDDLWIVGHSNLVNFGAEHAFLWRDGRMIDLGALGGTVSYAYGLNNAGLVVGEAAIPGDFSRHAFLWTDRVGMQDIGTLGGDFSGAYDTNDGFNIVGWAHIETGDPHAFFYDGGAMQDMGTLGGQFSWAWAMNESDQAVGEAITGAGDRHAFLWQDGVMYDLNDLIPEGTGWCLETGQDINDAGEIVGWGFVQGDCGCCDRHAFLLTPIEEVMGDLDGDGVVGTADLLMLLGAWGRCAVCDNCPADLDSDCNVGPIDLIILLGLWG